MPKYTAFAKRFLIFFMISHIMSYFVTTAQTMRILAEIRKTAGKKVN